MRVLAWSVLTLLFAVEIAAWAAYGVWGAAVGPAWLLAWTLPLVVVVLWALLAAPRARWGGPVVTPVTKVVVFGLAAASLAAADHVGSAVALLLAAVVLHALALLPAVRAVHGPRHGQREGPLSAA